MLDSLVAIERFQFDRLGYRIEFVRSLGILDRILGTPSDHRVHYATNPQYIDRNYGGFLIIFDRLFGSFEPEDEPCTYGLVKDWDGRELWDCQVHEFRDLWRDARSACSLRDALGYVFRPPGWKP